MSDSIHSSDNKRFQWRTVTAIGAATWLVSTQLSGCAETSEPATQTEAEMEEVAVPTMSGGEGEGGEGEGGGGEGEGEGAATAGADLTTDDAAYLTQLGLIRGHLAVGYELYRQDLPELAETHMKHPREEIYSSVVPAFEARGCGGFGDNLSALTAAVVERQSQSDVEAVYAELTAAITACEGGAATKDPQVIAKVVENLLRTGGVEYQIGIVDGAVNNLHEYQDAWGFTQIAGVWARSEAFLQDERAAAVAGQLQDIITGLDPMWPSLNPTDTVESDAAQLFGAAAAVQVAAFNLSR